MRRISEGGVWQTSLACSRVHVGDNYKYKISTDGGETLRADPYALGYERFPADASCICDRVPYRWRDGRWIANRKANGFGKMNIYALDLGSYMSRSHGGYCSYSAIARELAPYVKQMGYTHILVCDACEYTQYGEHIETYGYFAPTARHGSPRDFMAFVDCMHEAGVGVMINIDITEFPTYALGKFDGGALYEKNGDASKFDLSRSEVECFLASAAHLWLERYHIDGLALSGFSDEYCKERKEYLKVASFFRKVNSYLRAAFKGVALIARNDNLHAPLAEVSDGGLGFDMVVHDLGENKFSLDKGNFPDGALLCLGRRSLVGSLVGEYGAKFAKARVLLGKMLCLGEHTLTFSGQEIGQFDDMARLRATQWFLLDYNSHASLQRYVAELSDLCKRQAALSNGKIQELDTEKEGVSAFLKSTQNEEVLVLINGTDKNFEIISQGVPCHGAYREIFNSDDRRYAGEGRHNAAVARTHAVQSGIYKNSAEFKLPPLAITIFIRV